MNAVDGVDLVIDRGETYGIVGESGSGKSVTARSIIDLIESPGEITDGEVWYRNPELAAAIADDHPEAVDGDSIDLQRVPKSARRSLRGSHFSMIFQDPQSSFNPTITVGEQIAEAVEVQRRAHANPRSTRARSERYSLTSMILGSVVSSKRYVTDESHERAIELLELVGIPDPVERAAEYPHEYSGGMLQRAMIAQALAGEPDVLIADEPTTALDVTIQAQILDLLDELQAEMDMTILLITHNLGVVARMCDRVGVMYAGEIVERGTLEDVFDDHVHPYTEGLLGSVPNLDGASGRLQPIPGNVPSLLDHEMDDQCHFVDRCPKAMDACLEHPPEYDAGGTDHHTARCVLSEMAYDETRVLGDDSADGRSRRGEHADSKTAGPGFDSADGKSTHRTLEERGGDRP
ncbi:ABC-type dipeptide/oligopeptide/nickel transportsystem, ATPase component [Natrarchaeobaculum sulfurireducens]|uniref:Nickel import system ATP-binding protein NikD n=1 Tax=Natrarchaeobaculum sulfurireducens TaxID=2044521 RepID=A0A346PDZ8_9EURY|nr:ABC-type dipeptide/oligopeptide/nickel transportsystem, ATPase component [Natrarchaeobaculum sulfurireducens]